MREQIPNIPVVFGLKIKRAVNINEALLF